MKKNRYLLSVIVLAIWMAVIVFFLMILKQNHFEMLDFSDRHLIGASYMTMNNEFYKIVSEEISQKVEAEGDQLILRDPALSVDRQIEQIKEMLNIDVCNCIFFNDIKAESL